MYRPLVLLLLFLLLPGVSSAGELQPDHAVLFVGNSYTGSNAPNHLAESYRQLTLEGQPQLESLSIEALHPGGYTLMQHFQDAQGQSTLNDFLTDNDPAHLWNAVVLQDQSQLPAFPQTQVEWLASRDAAVGLAQMIADRGATPLLLMTYGRRNGDPGPNSFRFPDFVTMNDLLTEGYEAYAAAIAAEGMEVVVVPAGVAWRKIYDDTLAAGSDPQSPESLFSRLYTGDGSHPSALGTFLMACVSYLSLQSSSCGDLEWAHSGISGDDRATLAAAGDWAVANYEQPGGGAGDDDDTAGDDDDAADDDDTSDDDDSSGDDDDSSSDDDDDDGGPGACSCSVSAPETPRTHLSLLLLLVLSTLHARRRTPQP